MKEARKSVWTNAILTVPATLIFFFIGTALYAYYKVYPENLSISIPNGDAIFPWYIFTQLPVGIVGLLISGIFAAAMSTLSGSMNSAATAYIVDIYSRFFHKGEGGNELHAARMATCVIGIISLSLLFLWQHGISLHCGTNLTRYSGSYWAVWEDCSCWACLPNAPIPEEQSLV